MNERSDSLPEPVAFEWDEGNVDKIWEKRGVRASESEEVFFNRPLLVHDDPQHSTDESRHLALGQTYAGRRLCLAFTQRAGRIRVISARDMSRRERRSYAEAQTDS